MSWWNHGAGRKLMAAGLLAGAAGILGGVVAALPASAGGVVVCGTSVKVVPGDSGTCTYTVTWSGASSYSGPVDVALDVSTMSHSYGSGLRPGVGTEALLDGTASGLQVRVTDSAGRSYGIGTVSCYAAPPPSSAASPPDAPYCLSSDQNQKVASSELVGYSDTFTVHWTLPRTAGNQYQGGGATITLRAVVTGTASGATLGAHTQQGGVSGASTPTAGARLPTYFSPALVVVGLGLLLAGLWLRRLERRRVAR